MRLILALLASLAACDASAFIFGLPMPVNVVEFHNRDLNHYFLTADAHEMAGIDAGAAGPGWQRTGYAFVGFQPSGGMSTCTYCGQAVERFYGTPGLGPNSHFYTADADEAAGLRRAGSGWTFEKIAFYTAVPGADGACLAPLLPVHRLYNGRWMFNDSNHRYVTSQRLREEMLARGWADEGVKFCVPNLVDVPLKRFDVEIALAHRILPSAQCEDESQGLGSCLAINNLPVPGVRAGPFDLNAGGIFGAVTGVYSPEVYWPGGGYSATPDQVAEGLFVNSVASSVGIHIKTSGRDASSYASVNPLYQMRTSPGPGAVDERFFPFASSGLPSETELSIQFVLHVRKVAVLDASSHAYGHPTIEFIDARSGEHLYFTVLAYGPAGADDYLAPDVGTGKVIVGTTFRASTPYGRSVATGTFVTPPGFQGFESGSFDFRMGPGDFQRVIDSARTINPGLSQNPADYLVDNFHFNNEVVGNAEIGAGLGLFRLWLVARR